MVGQHCKEQRHTHDTDHVRTACWIFDWLFQLPNAYDYAFFNRKTYPRTIAWRDRYNAAIAAAKEKAPTPSELKGPDAVSQILNAGFQESDAELKIESDPQKIQEGDEVEMWPVDTGYDRKDSGRLVRLDVNEMAVRTLTQQDGKEIRIHYPRWNFDIKKAVEEEETNEDADGEFVTLN